MMQEPDDDLIREVYAKFGLAYYLSECLHRSLCFVVALSGLPSREMVTRWRVEELLAESFSMTLGAVVAKTKHLLPTDLFDEVQEAVVRRNYLAHRFWFERVHLMFSTSDVVMLLAELDRYIGGFDRLHARVCAWSDQIFHNLGITEEMLERYSQQIVEGGTDDPFPDRQAIVELNHRLRRKQRLVRVWQAPSDRLGDLLIFELSDGSLWQLCDAGLGWTRFRATGEGWREHPLISPHLPADILLRPPSAGPWDYEFVLAKDAALQVKPEQSLGRFRWCIRVPTNSPGQVSEPGRQ